MIQPELFQDQLQKARRKMSDVKTLNFFELSGQKNEAAIQK